MSNHQTVVAALTDLESDLRQFGVGSSAIVYPDGVNLSDSVRNVYQAIAQAGSINYSLGACDLMYLEDTDIKIEARRLTKDVLINTLAGKLVIPPDVKLRLTSRR